MKNNTQLKEVVDMADRKAVIKTKEGTFFTLDVSKIPKKYKGRFKDKQDNWFMHTAFVEFTNIWGWQVDVDSKGKPLGKHSPKATNTIRLGNNINTGHIASELIPSINKYGIRRDKYLPTLHYAPIEVDGRTYEYQLSTVGNHTTAAAIECLLDPKEDIDPEYENKPYRKGWLYDIYNGLPSDEVAEEMGWESNDTCGNAPLPLNKASQIASLTRLLNMKYRPFCDGNGKDRKLLSHKDGNQDLLQTALRKFIREKHTQSFAMTDSVVATACADSNQVELSHKNYTPAEAERHTKNVLKAKVDFEYDSDVGEYGTLLQGKKQFIYEKVIKALQYYYESGNETYAHIYVDTPKGKNTTDSLRMESEVLIETILKKWIPKAAAGIKKGKSILKTKGFLAQNTTNKESWGCAQTVAEVKARNTKAQKKSLGPF